MKNVRCGILGVGTMMLLFLTVFQVNAFGAEVTVGSFSELRTAVASATEPTDVVLAWEIVMAGAVTVPSGSEVTVRSDLGYDTLTSAARAPHFVVEPGATLTLSGITLVGATGGLGGGGIENGGVLTLDAGAVITDCLVRNTRPAGGGVLNDGGSLTIKTGAVITDSQAKQGGGVANINGGTVLMAGGAIIGNEAQTAGGGLYNTDGSVEIQDGSISGNFSYDGEAAGGSGIYNESGAILLTGGAISDNEGDYEAGYGIKNIGGTVTVSGGLVSGNQGGIYNGEPGVVLILGGEISGNRLYIGAGVRNYGSVTLSGGAISGNIAESDMIGLYGGGLYNGPTGVLTVSAGEINENVARSTGYGLNANGGGLYNDGGAVTISGGAISGNVVFASYDESEAWYTGPNGCGGGIYNNGGTISVEGGSVSGNSAIFGAGIFNRAGTVALADSTVCSNMTRGSYGGGDGGGIYSSGELILRGGEISGNAAKSSDGYVGDGGGVFMTDLTKISVTDTVFAENSADRAYWMNNADDINALCAQISGVTSFSAPPAGHKSFQYVYNNYDVSYTKGQSGNPADWTVLFVDWDGEEIARDSVAAGGAAEAPANPRRKAYAFIGWDTDFSCVTANITVTAQYEKAFSATLTDGITATVRNDGEAALSGFAILSVYDAQNRLVAADDNPFETAAGETETLSFEMDMALFRNAGYTYKVFFWDKQYVPLSEIVVLSE